MPIRGNWGLDDKYVVLNELNYVFLTYEDDECMKLNIVGDFLKMETLMLP